MLYTVDDIHIDILEIPLSFLKIFAAHKCMQQKCSISDTC